jgi:polyisoprenoid-binding protein YceI
MATKEWTAEEQAAATKLQTRKRMKRDQQRVKDIKDGKVSAWEQTETYAGGSAKVSLTYPQRDSKTGTFKVEKKSFTCCAGTFEQSDATVTLSPAAEDMGDLKIDIEAATHTFAVQGTDNWLTQE